MATLDRIIEMQKNGVTDADITTRLTNEGVPPTDINNSFNQARVKSAISGPDPGTESGKGMQASIMKDNDANASPTNEGLQAQGVQTAPPVAQQAPMPPQEQMQMPPQAQVPPMQAEPQQGYQQAPMAQVPQALIPGEPEIYPSEQYQDPYYQQAQGPYPEQEYYPQDASGTNPDTISEIAEQVATEKINEYKQNTGDILGFKNTMTEKVSDLDERLRRIEASIDKLQHAVIGKVGEFGENTAMIHKDLDNLHGTVQKLMDPLVDNINELRKISGNKPQQ